MTKEEKIEIEAYKKRVLEECEVDIDLTFCLDSKIKFENHEIKSEEVDLFNKIANKAAYNFVSNL